MPEDNIVVGRQPVLVNASAAAQIRITNAGSAPLYYGEGPDVSSTNNEGTIAAGASETFTTLRWFASTSLRTRVFVEQIPNRSTDLATQAELDAVATQIGDGAGKAEVEAEALARAAADSAHAAKTTSVHGLTDTSKIPVDAEVAHIVNAMEEGAKGDGEADDTVALQAAIDKAIELQRPLYLPPGKYKVSAALVADADNFCIFGAGTRLSVLVATTANFDVLTIGPAEDNAGNEPSGFARDFGMEGGDADQGAAGVGPDTGKAAFKLRGMTLYTVERVAVLEDSAFDIGFDLVNNCFGSTFRHIRTGFNSCRVGANLRTGPESGSDVTFFNVWLAGEVAAAHLGPDAGGFHFYGGQMSSSNGSAVDDDNRGTVIAGKEYTTGAKGRSSQCTFDGIDFEGAKHCWVLRTFDEVSLTIRECAFNADDEGVPMIGAIKGTDFKNSRLVLTNNNISGEFVEDAEDMFSVSGDFGGRSLIEQATSGEADVGNGSISYSDIPLLVSAGEGNAFAYGSTFSLMNGMLLQREDDNTLDYAVDWELVKEGDDLELQVDWVKLSRSGAVIASAALISPPKGLSLASVTGEESIEEITPTIDGHTLVLVFDEELTVVDGKNLRLAGSFEAPPTGTLTLICWGENWFEQSRSAN